jgi:hypothetical protein
MRDFDQYVSKKRTQALACSDASMVQRYIDEQTRLDAKFKQETLIEVGLLGLNPDGSILFKHSKADAAFDLAWEHEKDTYREDGFSHEAVLDLLVRLAALLAL